MPRENECYNHFSVLLLDSIANLDKKYYQQIFSEECKYPTKKRNIANSINEELRLDESDESDEGNKEN